jgi:hypothetical protein
LIDSLPAFTYSRRCLRLAGARTLHTGQVDPRLRAAVDASVCWYEEMFAVHGLAHRVVDGMWLALGRPPALHSAAKSVQPWASSERALSGVAAFEHCSIADSFATLNLPGFELLFHARWLFREPPPPSRGRLPAGWAPVRSPSELAAWTAQHDTTEVLLPTLLNRPGITVLARRSEDRLQAGAVLHACSGLVSLSNVWTAPGQQPDWRALVHLVAAMHPGLALTGYEHGEDLSHAQEAGFTDVGPHLVWYR